MDEKGTGMTTTVHGASDDLIEIEGQVCEEFTLRDDEVGDLLAFSNGVILQVRYASDGVWRIVPVTGADRVSVVQAPADDDDNYSDRATVTGDVAWVVHGSTYARAR